MVRSIAHLFFHAVERHPFRAAFREQEGREWTYGELARAVRETALGFSTLGVRPGDRVGLLADNSIQWIISDLALLTLGAVDVPRGTDTTPAEIDYLLRHSGARIAVLQDRELLEELAPTLADIADLQCIVLQHGSFQEGDPRPVFSLAEVRERGRARMHLGADLEGLVESTRDTDVATIVYTSGTTGRPKGVVLTHGNVLHNIRAIPGVIDFDCDDVFLSILPAWHMFERLIEYAAISKGCLTVYTDKRRFRTDLGSVRPTVLAAVPRVYELLYEETRKRLAEANPLRRALASSLMRVSRTYRRAVRLDPDTLAPERPSARWLEPLHALADRLLHRKIREALGGRLRAAVSGGGSLPLHIDEFFDAIGVPLLNGYGLTETAPLVAVRRPERPSLGTVGPPIPDTEIEIRDADGRALEPGFVGRIHVRGPQVMDGYYRDNAATQQAIDGRGFLDTGDLGRRFRDGELAITGRAKDTIVLRGGENVEPEPIENALRLSPYIAQVVVVGQDRKTLGALIVPDREAIRLRTPVLAGSAPADGADVERLIRTECQRLLCRATGFKSCEQVRRFALLDAALSLEGGELTETLKLKRHVIVEKHRDAIERIFAE